MFSKHLTWTFYFLNTLISFLWLLCHDMHMISESVSIIQKMEAEITLPTSHAYIVQNGGNLHIHDSRVLYLQYFTGNLINCILQYDLVKFFYINFIYGSIKIRVKIWYISISVTQLQVIFLFFLFLYFYPFHPFFQFFSFLLYLLFLYLFLNPIKLHRKQFTWDGEMLMLMILQDFGYFLKHNDLILRFAVAILKCRESLINCDRNRIKVGPYDRLWEQAHHLHLPGFVAFSTSASAKLHFIPTTN